MKKNYLMGKQSAPKKRLETVTRALTLFQMLVKLQGLGLTMSPLMVAGRLANFIDSWKVFIFVVSKFLARFLGC